MNFNMNTAIIAVGIGIFGLQIGITTNIIALYERVTSIETKVSTLHDTDISTNINSQRIAVLESVTSRMEKTCNDSAK